MITIAITTKDSQLLELLQTLNPAEFRWFMMTDLKKATQYVFDICICDEKSAENISKYALGSFAVIIWKREVEQAHQAFQHAKSLNAYTVISRQDGKNLPLILTEVYRVFIEEHLQSTTQGKSILISSAKGGVGKTTIALHLAKQLANLSKQKVLYIDCGGAFRSTSAWISINSDQSWETIRPILAQEDNLKPHQLSGMLVQHEEGILVLPAPQNFTQPLTITELHHLLTVAQQVADYIVVDVHTMLLPEDVEKVMSGSLFLLITETDIASTVMTQKALSSMKVSQENNDVHIILNKYDSEKHATEKQAIEKHLGISISHVIEFDPDAVLHYQMQGKLIDDPSLIFVDNIRHLADECIKPSR